MSPEHEYEVVDKRSPAGRPTTRPVGVGSVTDRNPSRVVVRERRFESPRPLRAWYENIPTWVSLSLFLHALAVLAAIVVLASPETFGLASEGSLDRNTIVQTTQANALQTRIGTIEQQLAGLQPGATAAESAGAVALTQRITSIEGRLAALCASATPPC